MSAHPAQASPARPTLGGAEMRVSDADRDAADGAPATFWPRLALTVAYSAALLAIAWAAWRHRAGTRRSPGTITVG